MKCFGVAAEFNPFHDGHAYLIDKVKEMTGSRCCIAAMSGDFTQRGEPAVFDKWERAAKAVEQGADLVVEIPQVYACSSAEFFARGAVSVLAGLGICDFIAFGSECGDIEVLKSMAKCINEHEGEINSTAESLLKEGVSYPKAREQAVKALMPDKTITPGPNDILAIEYLRQDLGNMVPVTVKRTGAGHNETASGIRKTLYADMPQRFDDKIAVTPADELERYAQSENGLGNKLKKELRYADSLEDLIDRVKSKAYTRTAITRLLTHVLLGIGNDEMTDAFYARVLAMNDTGAEALKLARKNELSTIPVLSNLTKDMKLLNDLQKRMISFDITAADVYNIVTGSNLYANSDHVKSPLKA